MRAFPSLFVQITVVCVISGLLWMAYTAWALPPGSTPREIELGEEAASDISQAIELVDDPEAVAKIQGILDEIALVTDRPNVKYRGHLMKSPLVNAFVLPGGWVYVTTGLLAHVESDDELAGVLAHEIAHNVNQHAIERMRHVPKGLGLLQLASLAALILVGPEAALVTNAAASRITAAVLNGGSVEAEKEADAHGLEYLTRTKYNPTGFLTFLERLAGSSGKFFEEEMGIYRTHPLTRDRVEAAASRLDDLGVPVLRRLVTEAEQPQAEWVEHDGRLVTEVSYLGKRLLFLEGQDEARREQCLAFLSYVLDHELTRDEIKILPERDAVAFEVEGELAFRLFAADGPPNASSEVAVAGRLRDDLVRYVEEDQARYRANAQLY